MPEMSTAAVPEPIQEQEEEGLRAFTLRVEASGEGDGIAPQVIDLAGRRTAVTAVEASWREVERIGYRVRLENGDSMLVYYVPQLDLWSGAASQGMQEPRITLKRRAQ